MPGLSHSRSDKVICCSFPTVEAIKFVHWVNRFERPLPLNSFKGRHYLLYFSTASKSLHHRQGSLAADTSAGVASTALLFCILYHLLFPSCGRFEAQWWCFGHASCSLSLSPTGCINFSLIFGKRSHGLSPALCLHWCWLHQKSGAGFAACPRKIIICWGAAMLLNWQQCSGCD